MMNRKLFSTLCIPALLLAAFVSCGDSSTSPVQTTEVPEVTEAQTEAVTEFRYEPNVPKADFGGEVFRVASCDPNSFTCILGFDFEEDSADSVESSIYLRNRKIEETYNVKFEHQYYSDWVPLPSLLQEQAMTGDDTYQLIMMINREAFKAATMGYMLPYSDIPYVDTTQPWYMQHVNEMLTVGGETVVAYTDECVNAYLQTCCLFFNKQILNDNDFDDPYTLVREGKWTQDAFYSMAKTAMKDVDGNGKFEVGDIFGVGTEEDFFYPSMWVGSGINTITKNADDIPVYTASGDERLVDAITVLIDHMKIDGFVIDSFKYKLGSGEEARTAGCRYFADGNALFRYGIVANVRSLRDMDADFGILPSPKYDETQERYYGRMIDGWIHVAPTSVQNTELLGTMIEALGAESKNFVIPAFFDVALTDKLTRDGDSEEMLDIIFDNITLDLGDTVWYEAVRVKLNPQINNKKNDTASFLTMLQKSVDKTIQNALDALNALEG